MKPRLWLSIIYASYIIILVHLTLSANLNLFFKNLYTINIYERWDRHVNIFEQLVIITKCLTCVDLMKLVMSKSQMIYDLQKSRKKWLSELVELYNICIPYYMGLILSLSYISWGVSVKWSVIFSRRLCDHWQSCWGIASGNG